jgi:hypothetical protein
MNLRPQEFVFIVSRRVEESMPYLVDSTVVYHLPCTDTTFAIPFTSDISEVNNVSEVQEQLPILEEPQLPQQLS